MRYFQTAGAKIASKSPPQFFFHLWVEPDQLKFKFHFFGLSHRWATGGWPPQLKKLAQLTKMWEEVIFWDLSVWAGFEWRAAAAGLIHLPRAPGDEMV